MPTAMTLLMVLLTVLLMGLLTVLLKIMSRVAKCYRATDNRLSSEGGCRHDR